MWSVLARIVLKCDLCRTHRSGTDPKLLHNCSCMVDLLNCDGDAGCSHSTTAGQLLAEVAINYQQAGTNTGGREKIYFLFGISMQSQQLRAITLRTSTFRGGECLMWNTIWICNLDGLAVNLFQRATDITQPSSTDHSRLSTTWLRRIPWGLRMHNSNRPR